ncbi:MAG: apolipoprotein N-acyltransferase, partial [Deltaproteobacteria bacterium]|nr:apolipoprotein N-acyltransferase [Deltaproteobacteria bacterium]
AWLLHSFRERRRFACGPLVLALLLVMLNAGYGFFRLHQPLDKRSRQLDVALVQGNVDQGLKWDPEFKAETITRYRKLSQKAAAAGADLIVWPESATPFYFGSHEPLTGAVLDVPVLCDLPLIFGAPSYEVGAHDRVRYFNSVFLASSQGEILGRSDKIHLVPFGEYNPLLWLLPSLGKLVHGLGDFSPGIAKPLLLGKTRIGTLICFEAVFPELARHWVRKEGCDLLVNVTNDAWFGRSAAPFQHIAMTTFRAVENRVWIARAANTGISALIAPSGRIDAATGLFEETIAQGQVGLGGTRTFYNRWGDVGPQLCVAATLLLAGLAMRRNRRQRTEPLRYHNNLGRRF